jgi:prophage regulatory protein
MAALEEMKRGLANPTLESPRFLRIREVIQITGLSRSGIYDSMAQNKFPQSVQLGARSVGWVDSEVRLWVTERIAARAKAA